MASDAGIAVFGPFRPSKPSPRVQAEREDPRHEAARIEIAAEAARPRSGAMAPGASASRSRRGATPSWRCRGRSSFRPRPAWRRRSSVPSRWVAGRARSPACTWRSRSPKAGRWRSTGRWRPSPRSRRLRQVRAAVRRATSPTWRRSSRRSGRRPRRPWPSGFRIVGGVATSCGLGWVPGRLAEKSASEKSSSRRADGRRSRRDRAKPLRLIPQQVAVRRPGHSPGRRSGRTAAVMRGVAACWIHLQDIACRFAHRAPARSRGTAAQGWLRCRRCRRRRCSKQAPW